MPSGRSASTTAFTSAGSEPLRAVVVPFVQAILVALAIYAGVLVVSFFIQRPGLRRLIGLRADATPEEQAYDTWMNVGIKSSGNLQFVAIGIAQ